MTLDDRGILMPCSSCGTTNRLLYEALERRTRCGRCHTALPHPSSPIEVFGTRTFDALISEASVPIVVDFWAPWCGPCRMMAPHLEQAARRLTGTALVVKVNIEADRELSDRFRVRSIPTLALFRRGREVTRVAGARSAADIEALVVREGRE